MSVGEDKREIGEPKVTFVQPTSQEGGTGITIEVDLRPEVL